jgi:chromosome segregation ATPase
MGIFGKSNPGTKLQELKGKRKALRERLEDLEEQKKEALAQVLEVEDQGGDSTAARKRLRKIKDTIEIEVGRLEKLQATIKAEAEAEYDRQLQGLPQVQTEIHQELENAFQRACELAAEAELLIRSYFSTDDQVFAVQIKGPGFYGMPLPDHLVALIGKAKRLFKSRQAAVLEANPAIATFRERHGEFERLKREGKEYYYRSSKIKEMANRED